LFENLGLVDRKRHAVVINGSSVDLNHYQMVPLPSKIFFLLIARLIREKGIYDFVEAPRVIKKRNPSARFVLVGSL